jgi:hypothetical protein
MRPQWRSKSTPSHGATAVISSVAALTVGATGLTPRWPPPWPGESPFRLRVTGAVNAKRLAVAGLLVLLVLLAPIGARVSALALSAMVAALALWELRPVAHRRFRRLVAQGHDPVPASPSTGVDTVTGAGLAEVMAGADVVVDVSNAPVWDDDAVREFFTTSTRNLLAAERDAGVGHHLAVSIVGADRLPDSGEAELHLLPEAEP